MASENCLAARAITPRWTYAIAGGWGQGRAHAVGTQRRGIHPRLSTIAERRRIPGRGAAARLRGAWLCRHLVRESLRLARAGAALRDLLGVAQRADFQDHRRSSAAFLVAALAEWSAAPDPRMACPMDVANAPSAF